MSTVEIETTPRVENGVIDIDYDLTALSLSSTECCGWFEVHGFAETGGSYANLCKKDLEVLCTKEIFWVSDGEYMDNHPLYCVLIPRQIKVFESTLLKLGWIKGVPFINPNTGNRCQPYQFVPDTCKV